MKSICPKCGHTWGRRPPSKTQRAILIAIYEERDAAQCFNPKAVEALRQRGWARVVDGFVLLTSMGRVEAQMWQERQ